MKKSVLKEYAKLIVKKGVNVQKGQPVVIFASVNDAYFVKYVIEEAYKAKASEVSVEWSFDELTKAAYKYETVKTLSSLPQWKKEKLNYRAEALPCMIHILNEDPDGLSSISQDKLSKVRIANREFMMEYRNKIDNKYQWTIVGIPSEAWAKKIFPDKSKKEAVSLLWDAILKVTRVNGDAVENWKKHNANIIEKSNKLNDLKIKTLHYSSKVSGTDFTVSLHDCTFFTGGIAKTLAGVEYNPNMPTEEVFTSPDKTTANGVVYTTKPLSVNGTLIDSFGFKFENGKVVEVLTDNDNYRDVLTKLITTDEGASMLGEVALVPYDSPINQTGLLFLNTLYDENACCHLAIGRGFSDTIVDYENKTAEEIDAVDLNQSMIHVDFMIGSSDLDIVAETFDGKTVQIFKNGTWAI